MTLRINDTPIVSARLFREKFDLERVLPLLRLLVGEEGDCLFSDEEDRYTLQLLREVCREDFDWTTVERTPGLIGWGKAGEETKRQVALPEGVNCDNQEQLEVVLLMRLAHQEPTQEMLAPYACEEGYGANEPKIGRVVELQNNDRMRLELFPLCPELKQRIRVVRFCNPSTFAGNAYLQVVNEEKTVIDEVRIPNGTAVYGHCAGNRLIELLPLCSVSRDHGNYWDFSRGKEPVLSRWMFHSGEVYRYYLTLTEGISQFCADDERGLLGVQQGNLMPMSSIFNPMCDLTFPLKEGEKVVKVVVKGQDVLLLTDTGRTFSNEACMERENIVSVGVADGYLLYALTSEGELLFDRAVDGQLPTKQVYAVYSCFGQTPSVKTRDGRCGNVAQKVGPTSKHLTVGEHDFYLDAETGNLMENGQEQPLAERVCDFCLVRDECSDRIRLLAYDGERMKEVLYEDRKSTDADGR